MTTVVDSSRAAETTSTSPLDVDALRPGVAARTLNAAWQRLHGMSDAPAAQVQTLADAWRATQRPALALATLGAYALPSAPTEAITQASAAKPALMLAIDAAAQLHLLGWRDWADRTWAGALEGVRSSQRAAVLRETAARWLALKVPPEVIEPLARAALKADARYGPSHGLLGQVLQRMGDHSAALTHLNLALDAAPDDAQLLVASAVSCFDLGQFERAAQRGQQASDLQPDLALAWVVRGRAVHALRDYQRAAAGMEQGWRLGWPDHRYLVDLAQAWLNLGDTSAALMWARRAVALLPHDPKAHNILGLALIAHEQLDEAEQCFAAAHKRFPKALTLQANFAYLRLAQRRLLDAHDLFVAALKEGEADPAALLGSGNSVATTYGEMQDFAGAMRLFDQGLAQRPDDLRSWANLLFTVNYHPDASATDVRRRYRDFDQQMASVLRRLPPQQQIATPAPQALHGRRLRVGYASPDFRKHSVRHFLMPLLAHHDRTRVELFAYAVLWKPDALTEQYQTHVDHWVRVQDLSDDLFAQRIRDDGIDVLVDVAGHTSGNRLPVFARKPAPVQVTWMGYGSTTGLSAIDHILLGPKSAPRGSDKHFAENPWPLPRTLVAYRPTDGMGECGPLPALGRGYVTFGTLSRTIRINHKVVALWAQLLKAVPKSRLVLNSGPFGDARTRDWMAERFAAHGIKPDRLEMGYDSPPWDVLRNIDITLDCFPHNSGTTLIESLYMGVPFVTLKDRPSVGLLGASINHSAGLDDWTASTPDEYLRIAKHWATHLDDLAALRARLRPQMQASALMDEAGFARDVEAAYFAMYEQALQKK